MSVTAPVSALIGLREGQTDPAGRAGHDRGSGVHGAPFGSAPVEGGERVVAGVGEHRVQTPSTHAHVAAGEDRQGQRVLQQPVERIVLVVIAVRIAQEECGFAP